MSETRHDTPRVTHADESLPELLDRWTDQGLVSPDQVQRILRSERVSATPRGAAPAPGHGRLAIEALGYLGGVILLAAGMLLVQLVWGDLSTSARLAIPVAALITLLLAGLFVPAAAGGPARLRSVLWLMAVGAAGASAAVLADQIVEADENDTVLIVGTAMLVVAAPLYWRTKEAAQHVGLFAATLLTAMALGARADWDEPTVIGLAAWLACVAWFLLSERRLLRPAVLGRYLAAAAAVVAALVMGASLGGQAVALVTLATLFVLAVSRESLGLLAVAALGTIQLILSMVEYWFPDNTQVAVPLILLGVGVVLVIVALTVTRRRGRHG